MLILPILGSLLVTLFSGVLGDIFIFWPRSSGCCILGERENKERTVGLRCLDTDSRRRKSVRPACCGW